MGARRTYLPFLAIAGCGRTELGLLAGGPDAATSSLSSPDVAGDRVAHSPDVRICQWAGLAPQATYEASVMLFANAGDGRLLAPITYAFAGSPQALAVADFNGDGLPDLAVTSLDNTRGAFVVGVFLSECR
jgi:hypothetical protein